MVQKCTTILPEDIMTNKIIHLQVEIRVPNDLDLKSVPIKRILINQVLSDSENVTGCSLITPDPVDGVAVLAFD